MQFFKSLWKMFKFGASATLGLPIAVTLFSLLGTAYLLAEATNIIEAKVKKDIFGGKSVGFSPFFKSISDGIRDTMVSALTDCAYAPIQVAKIVFEKTGREVDFTALKETRKAQESKAGVVIPPAIAAATIIPAEVEASQDGKGIVTNRAEISNTDSLESPPSTAISQPFTAGSLSGSDKISTTEGPVVRSQTNHHQ